MSRPLPVRWTERSLRNGQAIRNYLNDNFSNKEVDKFYNLLRDFEKSVSHFPDLYPETKHIRGVRRAVLNKYLSVVYVYRQNEIAVVAMQDNRQANPGQ